MRSPIAGPGILGDTIKIKALSTEAGNPGWIVIPVRRKLLFMGDLDDIQFQSILQDIAYDTVVPLRADNQANLENNKVRIMNNREWCEEEKHRVVEKGRISWNVLKEDGIYNFIIIIKLTRSKTILETTVEIEPQPIALDFKNLSQYSSRSK